MVRKKYVEYVNLKMVRYSKIDKSELFFYDKDKEIFKGLVKYKKYGVGVKGSCIDEERKKHNQRLSNWRAKSKIKKLIMENGLKYHYVTTYKDSSQNRDDTLKNNYRDMVLYDNKKFLKRLRYDLKQKLSYVAVPEYQVARFKKYEFKFLHMHIALAELIDERVFWSAWNCKKCMECKNYLIRKDNFSCGDCNGFRGVISVKDDDMDLLKIANYFTKYFTKGFKEKDFNQRTFNQKRYLNSSGLKMPEIIDIEISEKRFNDLILPNSDFVKSMGLNNNAGSVAIIDNLLVDLYLYGEKK